MLPPSGAVAARTVGARRPSRRPVLALRRLGAPALAALFFAPWLAPMGCDATGDGVVDGEVTVSTQDRGRFTLYSLALDDVLRDDAGEPLVVEDPSTVEGWDISLSRWVLGTNSGTSASPDSVSQGALLAVEGTEDNWASLGDFTARCSDFVAADGTQNSGTIGCGGTVTVDDGYVADALRDPDGAGPNTTLSYNPSLTSWFQYLFSGHEVVPYGHVYVLQAHDGACVKLQLSDYYAADGEGGNVSFSWSWLPE